MIEERIAIVDLADELQVRKQRIFKLLPRLGIRTVLRRDAERGNQNIATVSSEEALSIRKELAALTVGPGEGAATSLFDDAGFFYLIQLEPDHDPGRFKVGFTTDLDGRLQKHRCSAPFARYSKTWPCRRTWERAAIDCATQCSDQLHTEVFRTGSLDGVAARADSFFSLMPSVAREEPEGEAIEEAPS